MIYKYIVENGILKQNSLFQIPFKSANGYTVRIDDEILVNGLDYTIDGSRLWIERDIAGAVFSISDSVEDETNALLAKIEELEKSINKLNEQFSSLTENSAETSAGLAAFREAVAEKDEEYVNTIAEAEKQITINRDAFDTFKGTVTEELTALMDIIGDTENSLTENINNVLNTATSNYSALNKEIAALNDKLVNNDNIISLNSKYEQLNRDILEIKNRIANIPAGIGEEVVAVFTEKLSSLKQSLAMETAQRRRADMEIKLLLERCIDSMDRIEDIVISNWEDEDLVTGILSDMKKELIDRLDSLSRVTMASMMREFKAKRWIEKQKGGGL